MMMMKMKMKMVMMTMKMIKLSITKTSYVKYTDTCHEAFGSMIHKQHFDVFILLSLCLPADIKYKHVTSVALKIKEM